MVLEGEVVGEADEVAAAARAARAENDPGVEMVYERDMALGCWFALPIPPFELLELEHGGLKSGCDGEGGW